jgi:hypothetical protein
MVRATNGSRGRSPHQSRQRAGWWGEATDEPLRSGLVRLLSEYATPYLRLSAVEFSKMRGSSLRWFSFPIHVSSSFLLLLHCEATHRNLTNGT